MKQTTSKTNTSALTTGPIWKGILFFFVPILIGAIFQQLYNTVDALVVGQFAGSEALASVGGSSGQIVNFIFTFFTGLS
ncbi:MAG: MATE family efflux transporter, partial [Lachnospiraceae bacterium]|nr:MATE family efflux transporter [Lachnospiraceae bacterium]